MKKSILSLTILAVLFTACQTKTPEEEADSIATAPDTTLANANTCYVYIKNMDTVSLTLSTVGNEITGKLDYNFYEKDKNSGTITGLIKGDTLLSDYTFLAEGSLSVRQVAFIKQGNNLVEGYGPAEEKDGQFKFTNVAELDFSKGIRLIETPCQ